jgi:hypothetical protein
MIMANIFMMLSMHFRFSQVPQLSIMLFLFTDEQMTFANLRQPRDLAPKNRYLGAKTWRSSVVSSIIVMCRPHLKSNHSPQNRYLYPSLSDRAPAETLQDRRIVFLDLSKKD